MRIFYGNEIVGDHTRRILTSGFTVQPSMQLQVSLPVRAVNARPYERKNRLYTVRFETVFNFPTVSQCEDFLSRFTPALAPAAALRWTTTPPGGLSTWYLWKSKLMAADVPPYRGCDVTILFAFIGSHVASIADPNPDLP